MKYEAPDIDITMAQRQAGASAEAVANFVSPRQAIGTSDASFTFGAHASRPSSGQSGDRYFSTDRTTLYYYDGTKWLYLVGVNVGTNATRAAITVTANDNGSLFFTTDQNKLWHVSSGAWTDRFVTLDLTTSLKIAGTKVVGARGTAVADVASADATDLATVITLANETKAQLNALLNRVRTATGHGLIS
jgi:hypothetical protein